MFDLIVYKLLLVFANINSQYGYNDGINQQT